MRSSLSLVLILTLTLLLPGSFSVRRSLQKRDETELKPPTAEEITGEVTEEPITGEVTDEPITDEPPTDEPTTDEPPTDEPPTDEPTPIPKEPTTTTKAPTTTTSKPNRLCYTCSGFSHCETQFKTLQHSSQVENVTERCATDTEICYTHFTTKVDPETGLLAGGGARYIIQAGCKEPPPGYTVEKCDSTPLHNVVTPTGARGATTFTGTHGTRTCYCDKFLCGDNHIKCAICSGVASCGKAGKGKKKLGTYQDAKYATVAIQCFIKTLDKKGTLAAGLEPFQDPGDEGFTPNRCEADFVQESWEDDQGNVIERKCTCLESNCNIGVKDAQVYFEKKVVNCVKCVAGGGGCSPEECRRRQICVTEFVRKNEEGADFELVKSGCEVSPGGVYAIGTCQNPKITDAGESVSCHCNRNEVCGKPEFTCFQCRDWKDCIDIHKVDETCAALPFFEEPLSKECFISYDNSTQPPKLSAGCRDVSTDDTPDCGDDSWLQEGGGASSCRCGTSGCNSEATKELSVNNVLRSCYIEAQCYKEDAGPKGVPCQEVDSLRKDDTCIRGCEYIMLTDTESETTSYQRGCAQVAGFDEGDGIHPVCQRKSGGKGVILRKCFCFKDSCNSPENDAEYGALPGGGDDIQVEKKHKRPNTGVDRIRSGWLLGVGVVGVVFGG